MRALAAFFLLFWPLAAQEPAQDLERELKRFLDVYLKVREQAADEINPDQAYYGGAIPGMLRRLDPHSAFLDPDQFKQLQEMERSVSKGFGSIVSVLPGRVIVLQTMPGTPSQKAGLSPGDEIFVINNIPLGGLSLEQLVEVLSATRQQTAHLLVRRPGTAKPMQFTLVPEELQSPSVDRSFHIAEGVGYIRATSFDTATGEEIRKAIEGLGGEKLQGLILDLRDNPGGILQAGLATAALFLEPGARILSARGRSAQTEDVDVPKDAKPYRFKLAVLVNGKTASAAEIVAGAVQDHDRGRIIGETTFGKGLVQRVFPLRAETALALTTAFYYTPSGRSIQKPLKDNELAAATRTTRPEYKTEGGRTVRGGGGIEPDEMVLPEMPTRLRIALEASGSFASFASDWLILHRHEAKRELEITADLLEELKLFLSRRSIRPSVAEWLGERAYLTRRLKQEILNQAISVACGDEVELKADPLVKRALEPMQAP